MDLVVSNSPYDKNTLIRFILYTYKIDEEEIFITEIHDVDLDMEEVEKRKEQGADFNDLTVHESMVGYPEYIRLYDMYSEEAAWMFRIYLWRQKCNSLSRPQILHSGHQKWILRI